MPLKDNNSPLVTIIALCYNQEKYLKETLDSIINQSYKNVELIITDDSSKDNSVNKIKQWIKLNNIKCTFIQNEKNLGICKSLNNAIKLAKGEYLNLIACDDVLFPNKIKNQLEQFINLNNRYSTIVSDCLVIDGESKIIHHSYGDLQKIRLEKLNFNFMSILKYNPICAPTTMYRRKAILDIGGYDEDLLYEDLDMNLRLSKKFKTYFSDFKDVKYRWVQKSFGKQVKTNSSIKWSTLKILMKHLRSDLNKNEMEILNIKIKPLLIDFFNENQPGINLEINKYCEWKYSSPNLKLKLIYFFTLTPKSFSAIKKFLSLSFSKNIK